MYLRVAMNRFAVRTRLPVSAADAFAWHERVGAFARMSPPWEHVKVLAREGTIHDGDRVVLELGGMPFGVPVRLEHVHRDFIAGRQFRDEQVRGPFRHFVHTHTIEPDGPNASVLADSIEYELPFGALGRLGDGFVRERLRRGFAYRHAVLVHDLARHAAVRARPRLRIAITGASGTLGRALTAFLTTGGHDVVRLVRREAGPGEIRWDPARGELDAEALTGIEAVVHLAGASVGHRWTAGTKREILRSRVDSTSLLARTFARMARPPSAWISASAIGIYGAAGARAVHEDSPLGDDFLADVCRQWEAATEPARATGMRVVRMRIGVVLTPESGALAEMLPAFRTGLGGTIGRGTQLVSWISPDDVIASIHHALFAGDLRGPVNGVAPRAVTNTELTATLARVLHRPARLRVPAAAIELAFGEMGRLTALGGVEVVPRCLQTSGFQFSYPELEPALRHVLGRS
jgi:uncharacterized protein (TIGR01777 family)